MGGLSPSPIHEPLTPEASTKLLQELQRAGRNVGDIDRVYFNSQIHQFN